MVSLGFTWASVEGLQIHLFRTSLLVIVILKAAVLFEYVCIYLGLAAELSNTWNFPVLWFALRGTFCNWTRDRISRFRPEATTGLSSELNYNYRPTEWHINHASQSVSRNVFAPLNLNKQRAGDPGSDEDVKEPRERGMGLFEPERVRMRRRGLERFPDASEPLSARRKPAVSADSYFSFSTQNI